MADFQSRLLSVSRRTDIPAFFTPWFQNRLKERSGPGFWYQGLS